MVDATRVGLRLSGKCLVFYFKYQPEMMRLYFQKQPSEEFSDPETLKMVNAIGDQCCQEVASFLDDCGKIVVKQFSSIANCSLDKPNYKKWHVAAGVWSQSNKKPNNANWKMEAGVTIPKNKAELVVWMWGVGKAEAEEKMVLNFGDWVKPSTEVDLPAGSVALARIPILPEKCDGFVVSRDGLLMQIEKAFITISRLQFDNATPT